MPGLCQLFPLPFFSFFNRSISSYTSFLRSCSSQCFFQSFFLTKCRTTDPVMIKTPQNIGSSSCLTHPVTRKNIPARKSIISMGEIPDFSFFSLSLSIFPPSVCDGRNPRIFSRLKILVQISRQDVFQPPVKLCERPPCQHCPFFLLFHPP